jgi:hypothetical protein
MEMNFDKRIAELMTEMTLDETVKKTISKVKIKPGKMHKLLDIPEDKTITDVYKSPKKLVDDLMNATNDDYKKVKGMIAFAANIHKGHELFKDALKLVVKKD